MAGAVAALAQHELCMGCMDVKQNGRCPNIGSCGWTEGTRNPSELQLQPRTILVGRYLLGRVLGQGGFGITYLSFDLAVHCKIAVKEYFPTSFATRQTGSQTVTSSDPESREHYRYGLEKFSHEAQTLSRLRGQNTVAVMDFIEANETGYIVMEYLDGITLAKYLAGQENGRIGFEECIRILTPVMDALENVHTAHIIHRDVSPDNIFLCKSGAVKLIDFGAAREVLRDQRTRLLILKPGYTPWEQYQPEGHTGPWTDVYSLAATMYRCLTGAAPPEAPFRLSRDTLASPRDRGIQVPEMAERTILHGLAVRDKDRYQTLANFRRDLMPAPPAPKPPEANEFLDHSGLLNVVRTWWNRVRAVVERGYQPQTRVKLSLRFTIGERTEEIFELGAEPLTIGRDPARSNLVVELPQVSGAHARVRLSADGRGIQLEDLKSRNGTYVHTNAGWRAIGRARLLKAGDRFTLCDERTARFEVIDLSAL
ncbi:MAG: protein kinase domain-containing protein [Bryobacteraceae bacterium]